MSDFCRYLLLTVRKHISLLDNPHNADKIEAAMDRYSRDLVLSDEEMLCVKQVVKLLRRET